MTETKNFCQKALKCPVNAIREFDGAGWYLERVVGATYYRKHPVLDEGQRLDFEHVYPPEIVTNDTKSAYVIVQLSGKDK